jgi:hypothetical protein
VGRCFFLPGPTLGMGELGARPALLTHFQYFVKNLHRLTSGGKKGPCTFFLDAFEKQLRRATTSLVKDVSVSLSAWGTSALVLTRRVFINFWGGEGGGELSLQSTNQIKVW